MKSPTISNTFFPSIILTPKTPSLSLIILSLSKTHNNLYLFLSLSRGGVRKCLICDNHGGGIDPQDHWGINIVWDIVVGMEDIELGLVHTKEAREKAKGPGV